MLDFAHLPAKALHAEEGRFRLLLCLASRPLDFSDGVTETQNQTGEEFGPVRLYDVVSRNLDASAAGIRDRIEAALTKWSQGTPAADDITLVIVKRQAAGYAVSSRG